MNVKDMVEVARQTKYVAGLPAAGGDVGGDPGPHTSLGVFLGLKAAVRQALGKDSVNGLHIALQGAGSVATGVALHAAAEGARLSIADVDAAKPKNSPTHQGTVVRPTRSVARRGRVQPQRAGRDLRRCGSPRWYKVGGGANNQLRRPRTAPACTSAASYTPPIIHQRRRDHQRLHRIFGRRDETLVRRRIEASRPLEQIWAESARPGAIRRRSPTPWRSGGSGGLTPAHHDMHFLANPARFSNRRPATNGCVARLLLTIAVAAGLR